MLFALVLFVVCFSLLFILVHSLFVVVFFVWLHYLSDLEMCRLLFENLFVFLLVLLHVIFFSLLHL